MNQENSENQKPDNVSTQDNPAFSNHGVSQGVDPGVQPAQTVQAEKSQNNGSSVGQAPIEPPVQTPQAESVSPAASAPPVAPSPPVAPNTQSATTNQSQPASEVSQVNQADVVTQPVSGEAEKKAVVEQQTSSEERIWAVASYLPLVAFAVLVLKPDSKFCRLHATQGVVLSAMIFLSILVVAINEFIGSAFSFVILGLLIFGGVKAFSGKSYEIPVVAEMAKLVPVDSLVANVSGVSVKGALEGQNQVENQQKPVEAMPSQDEQQNVETPVGGGNNSGQV